MNTQKLSTILLVDDNPNNLLLVSTLLKQEFRVKVANNGEAALRIAANSKPQPDLILLDILMPDMDGYEVCSRLKAAPQLRDIPVIFLTSRTNLDDEARGLELGAVDYIMKPISPPIMLARVRAHLRLKASADFLRDQSVYLEQQVRGRMSEAQALQDVTIEMMASLAETRDNETGNHIRRTQHYVLTLAEHLKHHQRFASFLTTANIDLLFKSAPLHDIGKIGIPDSILLKPGRLEPHEFEVMKRHTTLGRDAIARAESMAGRPLPFLQMAKEIAYSHHEKWDGSGYPLGLSGEQIPVAARLMAIADVYDALVSCRPYKKAMSHQEAVTIIRSGWGSHFDPDVADAFVALQTQFQHIAARFSDDAEDVQLSCIEV